MQVYCSIYVIYQIKNTKSAKFLTLHTTLKTGWMDALFYSSNIVLYTELDPHSQVLHDVNCGLCVQSRFMPLSDTPNTEIMQPYDMQHCKSSRCRKGKLS